MSARKKEELKDNLFFFYEGYNYGDSRDGLIHVATGNVTVDGYCLVELTDLNYRVIIPAEGQQISGRKVTILNATELARIYNLYEICNHEPKKVMIGKEEFTIFVYKGADIKEPAHLAEKKRLDRILAMMGSSASAPTETKTYGGDKSSQMTSTSGLISTDVIQDGEFAVIAAAELEDDYSDDDDDW